MTANEVQRLRDKAVEQASFYEEGSFAHCLCTFFTDPAHQECFDHWGEMAVVRQKSIDTQQWADGLADILTELCAAPPSGIEGRYMLPNLRRILQHYEAFRAGPRIRPARDRVWVFPL